MSPLQTACLFLLLSSSALSDSSPDADAAASQQQQQHFAEAREAYQHGSQDGNLLSAGFNVNAGGSNAGLGFNAGTSGVGAGFSSSVGSGFSGSTGSDFSSTGSGFSSTGSGFSSSTGGTGYTSTGGTGYTSTGGTGYTSTGGFSSGNGASFSSTPITYSSGSSVYANDPGFSVGGSFGVGTGAGTGTGTGGGFNVQNSFGNNLISTGLNIVLVLFAFSLVMQLISKVAATSFFDDLFAARSLNLTPDEISYYTGLAMDAYEKYERMNTPK